MSNKFENLTDEELRKLAKDTVDSMSPQGRAELLEWAKKEFPKSWDHEKQQTSGRGERREDHD